MQDIIVENMDTDQARALELLVYTSTVYTAVNIFSKAGKFPAVSFLWRSWLRLRHTQLEGTWGRRFVERFFVCGGGTRLLHSHWHAILPSQVRKVLP